MTTSVQYRFATHWDAGDAGCGELIVGLRRELGRIRSGEALRLTARNAGAPADLPAWCRMTGHALVVADSPLYVIEKSGR